MKDVEKERRFVPDNSLYDASLLNEPFVLKNQIDLQTGVSRNSEALACCQNCFGERLLFFPHIKAELSDLFAGILSFDNLSVNDKSDS